MAGFNNARAAIRLQFRDMENFVHLDYQQRKDIRYVAIPMATALLKDQRSGTEPDRLSARSTHKYHD